MRRRQADRGKWDDSYPDPSPQRPVKINFPWFNDHDGNPYFPEPDARIFDPSLVTDELQELAKDWWEGYQTMRLTKLPSEYGLSRTGLSFEKYSVIFQKQEDLSTPQMDELWHYVMAIGWVDSTSYKGWRDLLKSNELSNLRTPKWYGKRSPKPPEVSIANTGKRKTGKRWGWTWDDLWITRSQAEEYFENHYEKGDDPDALAEEALNYFNFPDDGKEGEVAWHLFSELAEEYTEHWLQKFSSSQKRHAYDWFDVWIEEEDVRKFYEDRWNQSSEPSGMANEAMGHFGGDDAEEGTEEAEAAWDLFYNLAIEVDTAKRYHRGRAGSRSRRRAGRDPYSTVKDNEDHFCTVCDQQMEDWEAGTVSPEELVCDGCAGYEPDDDDRDFTEKMEKLHGPRRRFNKSGSSLRRKRIANQKSLDRIEMILKKLESADGQRAKEMKESLDGYVKIYKTDVSADQKKLENLLGEYEPLQKAAFSTVRRKGTKSPITRDAGDSYQQMFFTEKQLLDAAERGPHYMVGSKKLMVQEFVRTEDELVEAAMRFATDNPNTEFDLTVDLVTFAKVLWDGQKIHYQELESSGRASNPFSRNAAGRNLFFPKPEEGEPRIRSIEIGPTTTTEQIYDAVEREMQAVADNEVDGFRLGRYNIVLNGAGWDVSDFQTGQDTGWYPDKGSVVYKLVDDWMDDTWTSKNETPHGV